MKGGRASWCLLWFLLLLRGWGAEAASSFLAEGKDDPHKTRILKVFTVDVATKKVLLSRDIPGWISSMLSGDGTRLFTTDGYDVYEFNSSDLTLQRAYRLQIGDRQDDFLVHPRTGFFYFTTSGGSMPNKVFIVQPTSPGEAKRFRAPPGHTVKKGGFSFDPKREWVYVSSTAPFAIDPKTLRIASFLDLEKLLIGPPFALRQGTFSIFGAKLFPLADGTLLLYPDVEPLSRQFPPIPPMLLLYDPDRSALLRRSESLPALQVAALSRDGSRLFASTSSKAGTGAVIDTHTLAVLHTPSFPEPAEQLVPAPDGQGMWLVADSGKVYRLDDQTGQVLEQVPLPFRLRRVITPP